MELKVWANYNKLLIIIENRYYDIKLKPQKEILTNFLKYKTGLKPELSNKRLLIEPAGA